MIIVKTPLRITLGGGGTDLPFFYKKKVGFCVTASIKNYTYVALTKTFHKNFIFKYSKIEKVKNIKDIDHKIFKAAYQKFDVKSYIEATSLADIPSGSGVGSSGSFSVGLCLALNEYLKKKKNYKKLIEDASQIEMTLNKFASGKQDQYAVSYPGVNGFEFKRNDEVLRKSILLDKKTKQNFEKRFILVYSNKTRKAKNLLTKQKNIFFEDKDLIKQYEKLKELGYESFQALKKKDLDTVGYILSKQDKIKNIINQSAHNKNINKIKDYCLNNGAINGRILGAGGGGFLLFYTKNRIDFLSALKRKKLKFLDIKLDEKGPVILKD
jgi:D-glycero-alpha-D-manno-heptose-7-phosphate kinase